MNILIILLVFAPLITFANITQTQTRDATDEEIYKAIEDVLKRTHPNDREKSDCIVAEMRRNKLAEKFYTKDLLIDHEKLARTIQPFIDEASKKCTSFFKSLWGICLLIGLILVSIGLITCLITCVS